MTDEQFLLASIFAVILFVSLVLGTAGHRKN